MRELLILWLVLALAACGGTGSDNNESMSGHPSPGTAHPLAKKLMNDDFYWSPMDETAPFGNDDGADAWAGFRDWRQANKTGDPIVYLKEKVANWNYPVFDLSETSYQKLKPYLEKDDLSNRYMSGIDAAIAAIAFGQLYLEGTVDANFLDLAKTSIRRQLIPELLNSWGQKNKDERERKLRMMLAALNKIGS
ncbi:MAG: hypothetical protein J7578_17590 [Chitinophagaceae bacterium]|nr:hypothetical protein [Chitinophagaceae bacterium]